MLRTALILGAIIIVIIALLNHYSPDTLASPDSRASVIYSALLFVVIASSLFSRRSIPLHHTVKYLAIWAAIALVGVALYVYRAPLLKLPIIHALVPSHAVVNEQAGTITIRRGNDKHFHIKAQLNGQSVHFLVDTGATDIILTEADAQRIGINLDILDYNKKYNTANGVIYGASTKVAEMRVGNVVLNNVRVTINPSAMHRSLLGMYFFNLMRGFSVQGDELVIYY